MNRKIKVKCVQSHICISCISIFEVEGNSDEIKCPFCGYKISSEIYTNLRLITHKAGRYGYQYRKYYENMVDKNKCIKTKAFLESLTEPILFVMIAAMSGIIGGVSYDLIKAGVKKIVAYYRNNETESFKYLEHLDDDKEIQLLINYFEDYTSNDKEIEIEIYDICKEEEYTDFFMEVMEKIGKEILIKDRDLKSEESRAKIKAIVKKEASKTFRISIPDKEDLSESFKNI